MAKAQLLAKDIPDAVVLDQVRFNIDILKTPETGFQLPFHIKILVIIYLVVINPSRAIDRNIFLTVCVVSPGGRTREAC